MLFVKSSSLFRSFDISFPLNRTVTFRSSINSHNEQHHATSYGKARRWCLVIINALHNNIYYENKSHQNIMRVNGQLTCWHLEGANAYASSLGIANQETAHL